MDSILVSIKKLLGIDENDTSFDTEIILHINTVFSQLRQIGFGPEEGYMITGKENIWYEVLSDKKTLEMVKIYIFMKVKIIFDPPQNSSTLETFKQEINHYEWLINSEVESKAYNNS